MVLERSEISFFVLAADIFFVIISVFQGGILHTRIKNRNFLYFYDDSFVFPMILTLVITKITKLVLAEHPVLSFIEIMISNLMPI